MMTTKSPPPPADVQRWSEELARNPGSLAFLPLARAYRRQGRLEAAMRLCLGGLEQHPLHVEAHALLALLHLESGDRGKAADEWATVLRLKPGNFEALRGMGFRYLEQGEVSKARQHLERAALIRPTDTAVQEALRLLRGRQDEGMAIRPQPSAAAAEQETRSAGMAGPFSLVEREAAQVFGSAEATGAAVVAEDPFTDAQPAAAPPAAEPAAAPPVEPVAAPASEAVAEEAAPDDPTRVFDALLRGGPVVGALLVDRRGYVLAGRLTGAAETHADEVGALIGGTADEIGRTVKHLGLARWRGTVLECGRAILHISPAEDEAMLVVALRRETPHGWIQRAASQAASLAGAYLRRTA